MSATMAEAPLTERIWDTLEAALSGGKTPPLRVLFASDDSQPARAAEEFLTSAPLAPGSAVRVHTVLDALEWQVPQSLRGAEQEWARRLGEEAEARLRGRGWQVDHAASRGAPADEILKAADAFKADLVVVGSHGRRGFNRLVLGSVARSVANQAALPVLIARALLYGLRRVVLAVDGSEQASRAVLVTGHFPLPPETEITVCTVVRPYSPVVGPEYLADVDLIIADVWKEQKKDAERLVTAAADSLARWGKRVATTVRNGDPGSELLKLAAEQEADLVIVGARGMSPVRALIVGSVANRLMNDATCSVLIVH